MASTFGATELPAQSASPAGDVALARLGDFIATILNARAQDALDASGWACDAPVVREVIPSDPRMFVLDNCQLPALFVYRTGGDIVQVAEDWFEDVAEIAVVWMLPQDRCADPDTRSTFFNAIAKIAASAIRKGRDPLWSYSEDADPFSRSLAAEPDSIKASVATSLSAQTYSGAALNGARAGTTFLPRLRPTVTTAIVGSDSYNTTDPIVWTCVDWNGRTVQRTASLTLPRGGETVGPLEDVAEIISVDLPGQISTNGSFQFGTGAFDHGRGSDLLSAVGMRSLKVSRWRSQPIKAEEIDADGKALRSGSYLAMRLDLVGIETEDEDLTDLPETGADVDLLMGDLQVDRLEL